MYIPSDEKCTLVKIRYQHRNDILKTVNIYQHLMLPRKRREAFDFKKLCLFWGKTNFLNRLPSTEKKPRQDNQVSEAMAEIFNYIENHEDLQFTLKELRDVLTVYRSERLMDVLHSLGFAASYGKTVQYEILTAYHPQSRILSSESGALVRYVGDSADINVHTLDGNNTLYVMGMIKIVTPKDIY
ncbi:uncharacterized protein TNIN_428241 [Trichonephila inaurata madagascariensis]|uniref:Uncharacterized protein n=1 Tax=Trichonephila inaurata madagascariensis TaxID=2747483 RepID=A0A8X7BYH8_9ARAC|nr:uncharacterized protein TNIN_491911 [Trichonephila inaurata madagascariensis]GFY64527.1 uncharacterized protein TNIN_428241 [Trichonephila inaurata madagascariensis]